jgi:hypothetical protein
MTRRVLLLLLLLPMISVGSGDPTASPVSPVTPAGILAQTPSPRAVPSTRPLPDTSTLTMAAELSQLLASADPVANPFLNERRAEHFRALLAGNRDTEEATWYRVQLATELLSAGRTQDAIAHFQQVLEEVHASPNRFPPGTSFDVMESLGLAWLRLGEEENCIRNPTAASCILPIEGEGIHQITEGSRNAINYFSTLLRQDPDDLGTRWLLNVAYMTLGEYPDRVPPQWLVPMDRAESPDVSFPPFEEIASGLGLDVVGLAGGSIVEDFTGNGYLDILTSSWHLADQLRFFVNNGDGTFTERTHEAGLEGITGGLNMVHADYTNSGFPDVFVLRGAWMYGEGQHPNSLLRNNGDGTFTDVTREAGVYALAPTQTAVWGDFNNNGWVDLFVGNESAGGVSYPSELYLNNGDGTFREVGARARLDIRAYVKGVTAGDFDNDGRMDLYVSTLGSSNRLLRNLGPGRDGVPIFEDVTFASGVTGPRNSFPTWFWDFDNDGHLDIFVSGYSTEPADITREYLGMEILGERARLYRNNGDGTFTDTSTRSGLNKVLYTMGSNFGDLNNDGFLDFYLGTGDPDFRTLMPSRMFVNRAGGGFDEVTLSGRFGNIQKGHGVSFADMNHNGLQDIHMNMGGALEGDVYQNLFFRNPGFEGNWLTVRLVGVESNRMALGARITAVVREGGETREIHRVVSSGGSFGGNPFRQHLGLGSASSVERLVIEWPASGIVQTFTEVAPNRIVEITEGIDEVRELDLPSFEYRPDGGIGHVHTEGSGER